MRAPRYIVANVLLRYFLNDGDTRRSPSLALLQRIETGEESATTSSVVLFEVIFTLEKTAKIPKVKIREAITYLLTMPGLKIAESAIFLDALKWYVEKTFRSETRTVLHP